MNDGDARGSWICVDGVEGTGKTTIAEGLARTLPVELAPEFSAAPFGGALRDAVKSTPHYISSSPLGQSLVFLGDFLEVHASSVAPRLRVGVSVVSDRGYLSKYAYQHVVLSPTLGVTRTRRLLDEVFTHLPPPTLTIRLTAPMQSVRARLVRRDGSCDRAREEFIALAAESAAEYLDRTSELETVTIDTDRPPEEVLHDVRRIVRRYL
ncbi:MAG TPA: hypothetical protein VGD71_01085 [Kribbella sp.]|jgi:thymidylate kinase